MQPLAGGRRQSKSRHLHGRLLLHLGLLHLRLAGCWHAAPLLAAAAGLAAPHLLLRRWRRLLELLGVVLLRRRPRVHATGPLLLLLLLLLVLRLLLAGVPCLLLSLLPLHAHPAAEPSEPQRSRR
jgi:hypothetical protein